MFQEGWGFFWKIFLAEKFQIFNKLSEEIILEEPFLRWGFLTIRILKKIVKLADFLN